MKERIIRKIGLTVAMVIGVLMGQSLPVMATSEYPGHSYPERLSNINIPGVTVNRIDFENNQIEMVFNPRTYLNKTIKKVSMGWVKNHSEEVDNLDLLSYGTVNVGWAQKVFEMDFETLKTYKAKEIGVYRVFILDPDDGVDLKTNLDKRMFFIVDFTDGTKWIDQLTYSNCDYTPGKSCNVLRYQYEREYDVLIYALADAPTKFIRNLPETEPVNTGNDSVDANIDETLDDAENVDVSGEVEEKDTNETDTIEVVVASMPETIDIVNREVKSSDDDTMSMKKEDLDELDESENTDGVEEYDESFDGPGETTLDIPVLGGVSSEKCNNADWILIFISGAVAGTVLTSFLFSMIRYIKEAKRSL